MAPTADAPIMVFIAPSPRLNIPIVRFQSLMNHPLGVVEDLHPHGAGRSFSYFPAVSM
jgi:hypothetical protein